MMRLDEITCVWGVRGSGKTTLAKKLIGAASPAQLLIIDPVAADGLTPNEALDRLSQGMKAAQCNASTKPEQLAAIFGAAMLSTKAKPIYIMCDEAPAYFDTMSAAINKLMYQGRHAGIGMCLIGQRPSAVHASIRSQAATTHWLKMTDRNDIDVASQTMGRERAMQLQGFAQGQNIQWPQ